MWELMRWVGGSLGGWVCVCARGAVFTKVSSRVGRYDEGVNEVGRCIVGCDSVLVGWVGGWVGAGTLAVQKRTHMFQPLPRADSNPKLKLKLISTYPEG